MSWTEEKINQTMIDIKKKATEDEAFRKLCLDNPNEAINQVSGFDVPEGFKINIIENEPGVDHTIILPPESSTFKDEVLDQIAGGGVQKSQSTLPLKRKSWIRLQVV